MKPIATGAGAFIHPTNNIPIGILFKVDIALETALLIQMITDAKVEGMVNTTRFSLEIDVRLNTPEKIISVVIAVFERTRRFAFPDRKRFWVK